jgi:hypothetical protein
MHRKLHNSCDLRHKTIRKCHAWKGDVWHIYGPETVNGFPNRPYRRMSVW